MFINFQTQNAGNNQQSDNFKADRTDGTKTYGSGKVENSKTRYSSYGVDFQKEGGFPANTILKGKEKGKSMIDLQQEAGNANVAIQQDYMTVMSNIMSEEDYAKLEEEGFHFRGMKPDEAVSIVDKIKSELAASGTVVEGYNDDIDMNVLAEAVGSETLARAVADSFKDADIPATKENISDVKMAWDLASRLEQPDDGSMSYMIDNELESELWNFYLAQNSGMDGNAKGSQSFFLEDAGGYISQGALGNMDGMQDQIDRVIENAGYEVSEDRREAAMWLLKRGLLLTPDNLHRLDEIQACTLPITEEGFARAAAEAIAEGKSPIHANLFKSENIYENAARLVEYFADDGNFANLADNITARRQLEEIRFHMTAEVNLKLLKSGFSIDTAPMEELLDALRAAEKEVAGRYFPTEEDAVEKYQLMNQAEKTIAELPGLPADILGTYSAGNTDITLSQFHEEGVRIKDAYVKANESYEALMTAPRKDLGDNIKKAFANVDDIVEDLGLKVNEENRRAVRILGYNSMEITPENIEKVRAADSEVQNLMRKFPPAATLQMIRDGINPLEKSFEELNDYLDQSQSGYEQQAESYSKFLYRLENKKEISEDEREAYIGVYRLLRQIEKSDGAVVGALIHSQAQMHFSNLLSAVRSSKFKGLDVKIEDAFGAVSDVIREGGIISEQIARAFVGRMDEILETAVSDAETEKNYIQTELQEIRNAAEGKQDAAQLLQKGEVDANAGNLLAAELLISGEENLFAEFSKKVGRKDGRQEDLKTKKEDFVDLWEKLDDDKFDREYARMLEGMKEDVESASMEAVQSMDVKSLSLMHKQISIAEQTAQKQDYFIPMQIGDRIAGVHLTLQHEGNEKGSVYIAMDMEEGGKIQAHLTLANGRLEGIFTGNGETEVRKLKNAADIMSDMITEGVQGLEHVTAGNINVVHESSYVTDRQGMEARRNETDGADNAELYRLAKLFLQAIK